MVMNEDIKKMLDEAIEEGVEWAKDIAVNGGQMKPEVCIMLLLHKTYHCVKKLHENVGVDSVAISVRDVEEYDKLSKHNDDYENAKSMYSKAMANGGADMDLRNAVVGGLKHVLEDAKIMFVELMTNTVTDKEKELIREFGVWLCELK